MRVHSPKELACPGRPRGDSDPRSGWRGATRSWWYAGTPQCRPTRGMCSCRAHEKAWKASSGRTGRQHRTTSPLAKAVENHEACWWTKLIFPEQPWSDFLSCPTTENVPGHYSPLIHRGYSTTTHNKASIHIRGRMREQKSKWGNMLRISESGLIRFLLQL